MCYLLAIGPHLCERACVCLCVCACVCVDVFLVGDWVGGVCLGVVNNRVSRHRACVVLKNVSDNGVNVVKGHTPYRDRVDCVWGEGKSTPSICDVRVCVSLDIPQTAT